MGALERIGAFVRRERVGVASAVVVGALCALLLGSWVLRPPLVGLANNGDWYRYVCPLDLAPSPDVFFVEVPTGLVEWECPAEPYGSSFQLALRGARAVDDAITGEPLSMRFLATGWSLVAIAGWAWLAFELVRGSKRPLIPLLGTCAAVVVAADISFSAYFGSGYAEAMVFAVAPALAAGLARLAGDGPRRAGTAMATLALAALVSTAKPQLALTGVVIAAVLAVVWWQRARLAVIGSAVVGIAALVYSLGFLAAPLYEDINTVNLLFSGVLVEADDPVATLEEVGLVPADAAALARYEGASFWPMERGPASSPVFPRFQETVERGDVIAAIAGEPTIALGMAEQAIETLDEPRLDYLAHHSGRTGDFLADRPEPATRLLGLLTVLPWWAIPAVWLAALAVASRWLWTGIGATRSAGAVAVLLVTTAASQTAIAVADGYYELAKHLVVAQFANALLVGAAVGAGTGWLVHVAIDRARARSSHADLADTPA